MSENNWLKELESRIDWKREKRRVQRELEDLPKLAVFLSPEELEERRRFLEYELQLCDQKIRTKWK